MMKSTSNGGILNSSLQMLHVHIFLSPTGYDYKAWSGTDQHKGRVSVQEPPNKECSSGSHGSAVQ